MLTKKNIEFCEIYLSNGYKVIPAYEAVYGKKNGQTPPSYPYDLLRKKEVKEYVQKRRNELYDTLNIDALRILSETAEIAFADKEDPIYNVNAKLKALELLSKNLGLQQQKLGNGKEVIEVYLEGESINGTVEEQSDEQPEEQLED